MSVYTTIEDNELKSFLSNYNVGQLVDYQGISDGIENTNYFVNTSRGRFVLTIFEQHSFEEMQYYLNLMHHLADHKVPSANPVADNQGNYLSQFKDKPIALVERLNGRIGQLRAVTLSSQGRSVTGPKNLLAIVSAIKAHDADTAAQACAEHLAQAKEIALNELDS